LRFVFNIDSGKQHPGGWTGKITGGTASRAEFHQGCLGSFFGFISRTFPAEFILFLILVRKTLTIRSANAKTKLDNGNVEMNHTLKSLSKKLTVVLFTVLFSQQLVAQSQTEDDEWNHSLAVYLWGANMSGTTAGGSNVQIDFKDLLDHLEFGVMASYQARKGKWSILADAIYLDVSGEQELDLPPPVGGEIIGVTANVELELKSLVFQTGMGYNLYDDREGTTTDAVLGVRYLDMSTDLAFNLHLDRPDIEGSLPLSGSEDVWDAFIGLRGNISLGDRWFIPWGANVGAGESDLTWQAMAGVAFKAASWADIVLTYRYLKWELDGDLADDLAISGPLLGAIFHF
jgi:hypothetical protein